MIRTILQIIGATALGVISLAFFMGVANGVETERAATHGYPSVPDDVCGERLPGECWWTDVFCAGHAIGRCCARPQ